MHDKHRETRSGGGRARPLLAIETASLTGGVALLTSESVWAERLLDVRATYAERLLPAIDAILRETATTVADLVGIGVSLGPGSFTGLRIGLATAQGLAAATGIPLLGVGTLEGLAWNLWGAREALLVPVLDARREEVYAAAYRVGERELETVAEPRACTPADMAEELAAEVTAMPEGGGIVIGSGSGLLLPCLEARLPAAWRTAPAHLAVPRPAAIGELACRRMGAGSGTSPGLTPIYLRPAAARRPGSRSQENPA